MDLNKDIIIRFPWDFFWEICNCRRVLFKFYSVDFFWWDFSKVNVKFYLNDVKQLYITRCLDCSYVIIYSTLTMFILKIEIHNKLQQLMPNWTLIIRMCLDYEVLYFYLLNVNSTSFGLLSNITSFVLVVWLQWND